MCPHVLGDLSLQSTSFLQQPPSPYSCDVVGAVTDEVDNLPPVVVLVSGDGYVLSDLSVACVESGVGSGIFVEHL